MIARCTAGRLWVRAWGSAEERTGRRKGKQVLQSCMCFCYESESMEACVPPPPSLARCRGQPVPFGMEHLTRHLLVSPSPQCVCFGYQISKSILFPRFYCLPRTSLVASSYDTRPRARTRLPVLPQKSMMSTISAKRYYYLTQ